MDFINGVSFSFLFSQPAARAEVGQAVAGEFHALGSLFL
jgi:hypothetical protein